MARYLIAHLNEGRSSNGQILSGAGIAELQRGVTHVRAMGVSMGQYGMGWFADTIGQTKLIWHSGTLPDVGAYMALLPEQKKGVVLLCNACHHWMNPVTAEFGGGVAALLAGQQPIRLPFVDMIPWALRAQLLLPVFQIMSVVATLRLLRRWRRDPEHRSSGRRAWGLHILLPLIPNLLAALTLKPLLGKRHGYLMLYMPDYSWIALVCGSLSLLWCFLRTGLILRALRKPQASRTLMEDMNL
jgi:hypothetical protein